MPFISAQTEFGFKKIFASPQSKNILISFLNAMLYDAQPTIEDLKIIDRKHPGYKPPDSSVEK